jgi:uncharacterized protein YdiU (UPF0061 family)
LLVTSPLRPLAQVAWEARFVARMPGDPERANFTRNVSAVLYSETLPTPVSQPRLLAWSAALGGELGLARPDATTDDGRSAIAMLAGNDVRNGMRPYAARYGGHQFGHWAGQLGDGRALTLGELRKPDGSSVELQLKGAGPTPYSRRADGRAVLRSSVREYLCSEAMHHLGVPTTRALSLVATGDLVRRDMFYDGHPEDEPGAIVCRVAPSFLRFGNFEILNASGEHELLARLADLLIADHYPHLDAADPDRYGRLLDEIAERTAVLASWWMRVGFVHGVMNTDNMSALGLTLDYGPYGWLEPFDPDWTPNTTDAQGRRYRFGHQPSIAFWNVARFAEAMLPLLPGTERATTSLERYKTRFQTAYEEVFAAKIGLPQITAPARDQLVQDLFQLMAAAETDYTIAFRALGTWRLAGGARSGDAGSALWHAIMPAFYNVTMHPTGHESAWRAWAERYAAAVRAETDEAADAALAQAMQRVNPKYVLRNYLAQEAIDAAASGDLRRLERLERVLARPYDEQPAEEDLAARRPEWARTAPGCSALSCSS